MYQLIHMYKVGGASLKQSCLIIIYSYNYIYSAVNPLAVDLIKYFIFFICVKFNRLNDIL